MVEKETTVPVQKANDKASFYSPEAGRTVQAMDQAAAEAEFEKKTGEKLPPKLTNKPPTK